MKTQGHCSQIDTNTFSVRSQTNPENRYMVRETANGLVCECPDNRFRKSDCKHIKIVLDILKNNKCRKNNTFRIMERSQLKLCKYCDSGNIIKKGFKHNKSGKVQLFKCKDCKRKFTTNFGFENMRYDSTVITRALQMYFSGMSVRDIADCFEQEEIEVSYKAVYDWIAKYSKMTSDYLNEIIPRTNGKTMARADEI